MSSMTFHAKALELCTLAFQNLKGVDEDDYLEVSRIIKCCVNISMDCHLDCMALGPSCTKAPLSSPCGSSHL